MKKVKFLVVALVAMLGFISCEKDDCNHYDHSADLVGTWTCFHEGIAEALVISADGSMVATGVAGTDYWENVKGNITLKDDKATLAFEDNVTIEGHFDIIPGMAFSINQENGERVTFNYCKEDLSDEILGMWVCTQTPSGNAEDVLIQTFYDNGKSIYTGFEPFEEDFTLNNESNYKVIGDLIFIEVNGQHLIWKLIYSQDGTSLGDIMTFANADNKSGASWLRINQSLNLPGKKYDHIKTFVSNVKGEDKDIPFFGSTINFANLSSSVLDKFLKATLFAVQFPNANTIEYSFLAQELITLDAPITVEGNKMTVKMSANHAAYRDVEIYAFQDANCSQFHMYMPTSTFKNFIGNMQVNQMGEAGQLNLDDAAAVKAVFDTIDGAIETINVSLVMEQSSKARSL